MAGDWIKMRTDLRDDPAVQSMAVQLGADPDLVVGKLHRIWSWGDKQTPDGEVVGLGIERVDVLAECELFHMAMESVGWLERTERGFRFPRFMRHNGKSAKRRALDGRRGHRKKPASDAPPSSLLSSPLLLDPKRGKEGANGGPLAPYPDYEAVLEALAYLEPFLLGEPKANAAIRRLRLTVEDVEAWKAAKLTTRRRIWGVQRFKTPQEMLEHEKRVDLEEDDPSLQRGAEARRDAVLHKRARAIDPKLRELEDDEAYSRGMKAKAEEVLRNGGRKDAEPPPETISEELRRMVSGGNAAHS